MVCGGAPTRSPGADEQISGESHRAPMTEELSPEEILTPAAVAS
jgi:hypothetical protein